MNNFRTGIFFLPLMVGTAMSLVSCVTTGGKAADNVGATPVALMSTAQCEKTASVQGWNACSREAALSTYEYAQLASNVYSKPVQFIMPEYLRPESQLVETDTGLAYQVFQRIEDSRVTEKIIAFRGTEFTSLKDWWYGNLTSKQRREALIVYDQVSDGATPISVTGHSLGGALATQVSLCREVKVSVVFDSSPRFSKKLCDVNHTNRNVSVVEYGEVAKLLRIFGREADQRYVSLGCLSKGSPSTQHSMNRLAACLTNVAALEEDSRAELSKDINKIPDDADDWGDG